MEIFRIHIRPTGGKASRSQTFAYCLKNNILGVGWRINELVSTKEWKEYYNFAKQNYTNVNQCAYIKDNVHSNDLVWTRDSNGVYYLAKVVSGWEYWTDEYSKKEDIDIANTFRCEIKSVKADFVPGKVIASFRATRSIQRVEGSTIKEYSKYLWNKLSGKNEYQIDLSRVSNVFDLFDSEEAEDILFLYLQTLGYYVVPNSRKGDTMKYEFYVIDSKSKETFYTQVKTGNTPINKDHYLDGRSYLLFQTKEDYQGGGNENTKCIKKQDIIDFLETSKSWLPGTVQIKMDVFKEIKSTL